MNTWFTSDLHLGHVNIVKGCSKWENKTECRNFDSLEEHDEKLLRNINRAVKYEDILYVLGDFSFGGQDNIYKYRKKIVCPTVHLIGGNHDMHIRKNAILKTPEGEIPAQSLFSSYNELIEKDIGKDLFVLCHYALRSWHHQNKGAIQLYGHSHGRLIVSSEFKHAKSMDVGVDTHREFRPYHIDEIREIMKNKENIHIEKRWK